MYKKYTIKHGVPFRLRHKIMLAMRLTIVILIVSLMQVSASSFGQRITINQKNANLKSIFKEIRKQTGYDFYYDGKTIADQQKLDVTLTNTSVEDALTIVLKDLNLVYQVEGKIISIKKKEVSLLDRLIKRFVGTTLKGRLTDENGQPLVGATVMIKALQKGTTTNANGEFTLNDVDENTILVISFIGYQTQEVKVGKDQNLTIRMVPSTSDLQQVMVTGYQTISKERATGSFNIISGEQLNKPSTNIAQRLIGTTAGMQATLDADGNPRFEIRGQTTLNNRDLFNNRTTSGNPLVVVDGFAIQGDFSTINPNDIESITILKDAAAASIWGAKSANGVIVIVSKHAKKGVPLRVDFSAFTRVSSKLDLDYVNPLASTSETIDYEIKSFGNWSASINPGLLSSATNQNSPATVALNEYRLGYITLQQRDAQLAYYRTLNNTQQIKDELLTNPSTQQYNLSLSGSSEKMSNAVSLLFEDSKSNFKGTNNKKYLINYRVNADIFKWLEFSFSGMVNYNKLNRNGVTLADIQGIAPYEMLKKEDGSLNDISKFYTPVLKRSVPTGLFPYTDWTYNPIQEIANREVTSEQLSTRLQAGLRIKLIKGLTFDSKIQYELSNTTNRRYRNENTFSVRDSVNKAVTWDQTTNKITLNLPKGGMLDQNRNKTQAYNFRNQLNFDRKFNDKHEINVVAGSEINNAVTESFTNPTTYGYNNETLVAGNFPNGPGGTTFPIRGWMGANQTFGYTNSFTSFTDRYFSLFGNAAYTYNDKYSVSGSVRTDASNLITDDPSYRYAPFWSVGLGWQVDKEKFLRNIGWINRLNLRATFGYNGNVDRSTSFRPLIAIAAAPNAYTGDATSTISSYGNPTLRWEKTSTWNVGLDYSLFNNQLYGKIDVYNKSGKDLIASVSIPAVDGTTSQKLNNAEMYNRGIELELGTLQRIKGDKIYWRGNVNFAYNKNKITRLFISNYTASTLVAGGSLSYVEGYDANTLWRFQYAGIQNTQPVVYGANGTKYDFNAFTPGDGRDYLLRVGTTVAPYTLGFTNAFQVYDFNLSFIITGKFGNVFQRKGFNYPPSLSNRVLPNSKITEVTNGDPMTIVPLPLNLIEPNYFFWDRFDQNLSYLIENASQIRMQEINLTYNLPARLASKLKMNQFQVFAQGNNLFSWFANHAGEDPEYPLGTLKPQPTAMLGIKCQF